MEVGKAIQTNGVGQKCVTHLNLTTTLAQVWGRDPVEIVRTANVSKRKPAKPAFTKIRFAGQE